MTDEKKQQGVPSRETGLEDLGIRKKQLMERALEELRKNKNFQVTAKSLRRLARSKGRGVKAVEAIDVSSIDFRKFKRDVIDRLGSENLGDKKEADDELKIEDVSVVPDVEKKEAELKKEIDNLAKRAEKGEEDKVALLGELNKLEELVQDTNSSSSNMLMEKINGLRNKLTQVGVVAGDDVVGYGEGAPFGRVEAKEPQQADGGSSIESTTKPKGKATPALEVTPKAEGEKTKDALRQEIADFFESKGLKGEVLDSIGLGRLKKIKRRQQEVYDKVIKSFGDAESKHGSHTLVIKSLGSNDVERVIFSSLASAYVGPPKEVWINIDDLDDLDSVNQGLREDMSFHANGEGEEKFADGSFFRGEFKDGNFEKGFVSGLFFETKVPRLGSVSGKYTGEAVRKGDEVVPNGEGVLKRKLLRNISGTWKDGELITKGKVDTGELGEKYPEIELAKVEDAPAAPIEAVVLPSLEAVSEAEDEEIGNELAEAEEKEKEKEQEQEPTGEPIPSISPLPESTPEVEGEKSKDKLEEEIIEFFESNGLRIFVLDSLDLEDLKKIKDTQEEVFDTIIVPLGRELVEEVNFSDSSTRYVASGKEVWINPNDLEDVDALKNSFSETEVREMAVLAEEIKDFFRSKNLEVWFDDESTFEEMSKIKDSQEEFFTKVIEPLGSGLVEQVNFSLTKTEYDASSKEVWVNLNNLDALPAINQKLRKEMGLVGEPVEVGEPSTASSPEDTPEIDPVVIETPEISTSTPEEVRERVMELTEEDKNIFLLGDSGFTLDINELDSRIKNLRQILIEKDPGIKVGLLGRDYDTVLRGDGVVQLNIEENDWKSNLIEEIEIKNRRDNIMELTQGDENISPYSDTRFTLDVSELTTRIETLRQIIDNSSYRGRVGLVGKNSGTRVFGGNIALNIEEGNWKNELQEMFKHEDFKEKSFENEVLSNGEEFTGKGLIRDGELKWGDGVIVDRQYTGKGRFMDGELNGQGEEKFGNGMIFRGDFKDGYFVRGFAENMYFSTKVLKAVTLEGKYTGEAIGKGGNKAVPNGQGVLKRKLLRDLSGTWEDGKFMSKGEVDTDELGEKYPEIELAEAGEKEPEPTGEPVEVGESSTASSPEATPEEEEIKKGELKQEIDDFFQGKGYVTSIDLELDLNTIQKIKEKQEELFDKVIKPLGLDSFTHIRFKDYIDFLNIGGRQIEININNLDNLDAISQKLREDIALDGEPVPGSEETGDESSEATPEAEGEEIENELKEKQEEFKDILIEAIMKGEGVPEAQRNYDKALVEVIKEQKEKASKVFDFLREQQEDIDKQIEAKYMKGEGWLEKRGIWWQKLWRQMGDINLYNLANNDNRSESETDVGSSRLKKFGRFLGKTASVRSFLSYGLMAGGLVTGQSIFLEARAGLAGTGAGMASRDIMDRVGKAKMQKEIRLYESQTEAESIFESNYIGKAEKKDKKLQKWLDSIEVLDESESLDWRLQRIEEGIQNYQGYALINKIDLNQDAEYRRLLDLRMKLREQREGELLTEAGLEGDSEIPVENISDLLDKLQHDSSEQLAKAIDKAKVGRWGKRIGSLAIGVGMGAFVQLKVAKILMDEVGATEKIGKAWGWAKGLFSSEEATGSIGVGAEATPAVEEVKVGKVAVPKDVVLVKPEAPVVETPPEAPTPIAEPESAPVAEPVIIAEPEVAKVFGNPDFDVNNFQDKWKLNKETMAYLGRLTQQYPELNNEETLNRMFKVGKDWDIGKGVKSEFDEAFKGMISNPLEAAREADMIKFEEILDAGGDDRATEYLMSRNLNAHSLKNMGINFDKDPDIVRQRVNEFVREYKDNVLDPGETGGTKDAKLMRRLGDALQHDENRDMYKYKEGGLFNKEKRLFIRKGLVLGMDETQGGNARDLVHSGFERYSGPKLVPEVVPEEVPTRITTNDLGVDKHTIVKAYDGPGGELRTITLRPEEIIDIKPDPTTPEQQIATFLDSEGKVHKAVFHLKGGTGGVPETIVLEGIERVAESDLTSTEMAEVLARKAGGTVATEGPLDSMYKNTGAGSGTSARGVSGGGGGGAPQQVIEERERMAKFLKDTGTKAEGRTVISNKDGIHFTEEEVGADVGEGKAPKVGAENEAVKEASKAMSGGETDIEKIYQPEVPEVSEVLSDTASLGDVEKFVDSMSDWSEADKDKAKVFVGFMQLQDKLIDNGAVGLRKVLGEVVPNPAGKTNIAKNWIKDKVINLAVGQQSSVEAIKNGLNAGQPLSQIQDNLSNKMFAYGQALSASDVPNADNATHANVYRNHVKTVLEREYEDGGTKIRARLELVGNKGGGTASQ